jgi:hypothetical protein
MSEQATFQEENINIDLWLAELRSLGISVKCSKKKNNNGLNESTQELVYLTEYVKKTLYQDYKMAYSEH